MATTRSPAIDIAVEAGDWPPKPALRRLAQRAVAAAVAAVSPPSLAAGEKPAFELSIVFTDDSAMRRLNAKWRGKDKPTNVLSFPQAPGALLGDIVLAAETVKREAALADKRLEDHIAHLIIHGFLHLLGYDHESGGDAEEMEQLERVALARIGIADPYAAAQRP
jgi:probable rRNA maturation factor